MLRNFVSDLAEAVALLLLLLAIGLACMAVQEIRQPTRHPASIKTMIGASTTHTAIAPA